MNRQLQLIWDRVSIYLPLILMGLLALGSWWLVRSTPGLSSPPPVVAARHEPDYFMRNFSIKTFDDTGRLKNEIFGVQARHFPDTDTVEIDRVRLHAVSEQGGIITAAADRALTNGDGSEVQLFGNASVVREAHTDASGRQVPASELHSEFIQAYANVERLKTDKPVLLLRGKDRVSADGMDFDNVERVLSLHGHVRGELQAKPAK
jgi:lipopolysaccharide export system protein LptC